MRINLKTFRNMFTGILKAIVPAVEVKDQPGLKTFTLQFPKDQLKQLKRGASVAIDGVCCTVTVIDDDRVSFDAMEETLQKTTIGSLQKGDEVNIERSFKVGDEIGGHIVSGHVTGKAKIIKIETPENNHILTFQVPAEQMKYIFPKGFVALNGASLTVVDVNKTNGTFTVHLIPETLTLTTFRQKKEGDEVNFEIDSRTQTIVDTIEAYLQERT